MSIIRKLYDQAKQVVDTLPLDELEELLECDQSYILAEYRPSLSPQEKDDLLYIMGAGDLCVSDIHDVGSSFDSQKTMILDLLDDVFIYFIHQELKIKKLSQ